MKKSKGYLKEKNGRYYARVAVPVDLREVIGKGEMLVPLGTDRQLAEKQLVHEAVALIRGRFNAARAVTTQSAVTGSKSARTSHSLSPERIAVLSYKDRLHLDTVFRQASPAWSTSGIDDQIVEGLRAGMAGRLENGQLAELVGNRIELFRALGYTEAEIGSPSWRTIAIAVCASEFEALSRVAERDEGEFGGKPSHPILESLDAPEQAPPADLMELWEQYVARRQKEGSMQDGGRRQVLAVKSLIEFTKKTNANDLTDKDRPAFHRALSVGRALMPDSRGAQSSSEPLEPHGRMLARGSPGSFRPSRTTTRSGRPPAIEGHSGQRAYRGRLDAPLQQRPARRDSLPLALRDQETWHCRRPTTNMLPAADGPLQ